MGPLFVLFFWLIVGVIALSIYGLLHLLGKRSPVALQLKTVMPAAVAAIVIALAILVILNFFRIIFSQ
ncbi:MAG TPA: hypothetical protein PLK30_19220 [Blastocatellia bacterium]|nr:hypothetical protein [Blastocatellia bacterium]